MTIPSWAKTVLGDQEVDVIEAAIAAAESRTSGEIVPVLLRRSSTVGHVPLILFFILLVLALLMNLPELASASVGGPTSLWFGISGGIAAVAALGAARFDFMQRFFTSKLDQMRQVDLRAQIEFYERGLENTSARTGVLLLVSLMEHRAVVLADRGIAEKLAPEIWQEVVDLMVAGVKAKNLSSGIAQAVERCGELLAPHFPIQSGDENELRDHLVIKE